MDVMTPGQRYAAMAHNRGRTAPELDLASALWKKGLRYLTDCGYKARHGKSLPGHPDLIFTRKKVVVFLDGCYWHGCPTCQKSARETNPFWLDKIKSNRERDQRNTALLEGMGWCVLRIWEHQVRRKASVETTLDYLVQFLNRLAPGSVGADHHHNHHSHSTPTA